MKCDRCNREYKNHELETISQTHARHAYGLNDNRLGNYYLCVKCRSELYERNKHR